MRLYAFELHLLQTRIERCRHTRLQSLGYIRCWSVLAHHCRNSGDRSKPDRRLSLRRPINLQGAPKAIEQSEDRTFVAAAGEAEAVAQITDWFWLN